MSPATQCWKCIYFQRLEAHSGDCALHDRTVQATAGADCADYRLDPIDVYQPIFSYAKS